MDIVLRATDISQIVQVNNSHGNSAISSNICNGDYEESIEPRHTGRHTQTTEYGQLIGSVKATNSLEWVRIPQWRSVHQRTQ